jgi:predicted phage-related endonuclease
MSVDAIEITSRDQWLALRKQDVTASAAAALMGVHPYMTAYGLAAEKRGLLAPVDEGAGPLKRGRKLEAVVIEEVAERRPTWKIAPATTYFRDPALRLGATPDTMAFDPERGPGTVQIKTVAEPIFAQKWKVDGEIVIPPWIAIQANVEAQLMGAKWVSVGLLVVGFGWEVHILDVPLHAGIFERAKRETAAFWGLMDAGKTPDPDYGRDGATIARVYAQANPGRHVDLSSDNRLPELLMERETIKARQKADEDAVKVIDAEIKAKLEDADTASLPGWSITNKVTVRKEYTVKSASYRTLRITNVAHREAAE